MANRVGQEQQNTIQQGQVAGQPMIEPTQPAAGPQPAGMMVTPNGMAGPTASEQAYDGNAAQTQPAANAGGVSAVAGAATAAAAGAGATAESTTLAGMVTPAQTAAVQGHAAQAAQGQGSTGVSAIAGSSAPHTGNSAAAPFSPAASQTNVLIGQ